jgi:single-strand DNA-binding protein
MNKVVLTGNLTKDVTVITSKTGDKAARFSMAVSFGFGDKKRTDFFDIVTWHKADVCAKYLKKGSKVGIVGRLQQRIVEGKDGMKHSQFEVVADEVEFFNAIAVQQEIETPQAPETIPDEDLPF